VLIETESGEAGSVTAAVRDLLYPGARVLSVDATMGLYDVIALLETDDLDRLGGSDRRYAATGRRHPAYRNLPGRASGLRVGADIRDGLSVPRFGTMTESWCFAAGPSEPRLAHSALVASLTGNYFVMRSAARCVPGDSPAGGLARARAGNFASAGPDLPLPDSDGVVSRFSG